MDSVPTDTRQEPVLVFGGACKTFHRLDPDAESLTPLCGQQGNSPYLKDRDVLKRHYSLAFTATVGVSPMGDEGSVECDVCGAAKPSDFVDETTVATIEPLTASICRVCQFVQDHEMPEGRCIQCGDELEGAGFHIEVEFPLGPRTS